MERNHVDPLFIEPDQIIEGLSLLDGHMASQKFIWGKTYCMSPRRSKNIPPNFMYCPVKFCMSI